MKGKKFLQLLLIFMLIVAFSCGKKEKTEDTGSVIEEKMEEIAEEEVVEEIVTEEKIVEREEKAEVPQKPQYEGRRIYEVQLASLKDQYSVELHQEIMAKKGIETYISEFQKDDELFYRLRLKGKYYLQEAKELGEKMKKDFWSVTEYWVVSSE